MAPQQVEIPVSFPADSGDCAACASRLGDELASHRGILKVEPLGQSAVRVSYEPDLCSLECLEDAAKTIGAEMGRRFRHEVVPVEGMDCFDCAQTIEHAVRRIPQINYVSVNFAAGRMRFEFEGADPAQSVRREVAALGYKVPVKSEAGQEQETLFARRRVDMLPAVSAGLLIGSGVAFLLGVSELVLNSILAGSIIAGGIPVARSGIAALRATRRPDINLLMTIAVIGAAGIGEWLEGALIVVLFSAGAALESRAMRRARASLASLISITPEKTKVLREGIETEILVADIAVDDLLVIRPGEFIPADGKIDRGESSVDQSPITGESLPVEKMLGDPVFAGTSNGEGMLVVRVERAPGDTTLDRIARAVEEAQTQKAPAQRWVDSFARVYTPIVMGAAVLIATIPPLVGLGPFSQWFYRGLAFLILSCPCALVIATPVSVVSALARATRAGVLVKGGAALEAAAKVSAVAFDKTGTVTTGDLRVSKVETFDGRTQDRIVAMAASLEAGSEHPIARAITKEAARWGATVPPAESFRSLRGFGVEAVVNGSKLTLGKPRLFDGHPDIKRALSLVEEMQRSGRTVVLIGDEKRLFGALGLSDQPRPGASPAMEALRDLGVAHIAILTGDTVESAHLAAEQLSVDDVRAELLPEDKVQAISDIQKRNGATAMVGDGVNDGPALARSSLGVAMAAMGSPLAIETADVALMTDDLGQFPRLIALARWTRSIVRQNIAFSLAVKCVTAVLALIGVLHLWMAVLADVGATLIVVTNALRLLRGRPGFGLLGVPVLEPATRDPRRARSAGDQA